MPPEYPFGRVVGRVVQVVQGLPGDGSEPVYTPVRAARVRFDPVLDDERLRILQSSTPTSLMLQPFICATDEDGYLINGVGERWQELPATVDPGLGFSEWLWRCTITTPVGNPASFRFVLPVYTGPGTERDITTVAHVPSTPGRELAEWESVYLRAQGVLDQVVAVGAASVAAAQEAAALATAQADRAEAAADSIDVARIEALIAAKADLVDGKVPFEQLPVLDETTP